MNYTFNFEKINALLYDFYKSTGIAVGFYDSLFNPIGGSNVLSPYCEKIKSNAICLTLKACALPKKITKP